MPLQDSAPKPVALITVISSYFGLLKDYKFAAITVVGLSVVTAVFEMLAIIFMLPLLKNGIAENPGSDHYTENVLIEGVYSFFNVYDRSGTHLLGLFLAISLLSVAMKWLNEAFRKWLTIRYEKDFRENTIASIMNMDWLAFQKVEHNRVQKAFFVDAARISEGVENFVNSLSLATITGILFLSEVIIAPKLTLYTGVFAATVIVFYVYLGRKARAHSQVANQNSESFAKQLQVILKNVKYCLISNKKKMLLSLIGADIENYRVSIFKTHLLGSFVTLFQQGLGVIFISGVLGYSLIFDPESFMVSVAFLGIFYRIAPQLQAFYANLFAAQVRFGWYDSWKALYDEANAKRTVADEGKLEPQFAKNFVFDKISYAYEKGQKPILDAVSGEIESGKFYAFVGKSGCGKSTLIDLFTAMLPPDAGSITIDGVEVQSVNKRGWRQKMALSIQNTPLFHESVAANISWLEPNPNRERLVEAAKLADIYEFIMTLPNGFDTILGEDGGGISGGQRQRIALARAFYQNPDVYIIDEATSALDAESEAKIIDTLKAMQPKKTIIWISHRVYTARHADDIFVLKDGHIVERGHWTKLVENEQGYFKQLVDMQELN